MSFKINTNPALFINREAIEQHGNLQLPAIYCDKVKNILERLQRSFENPDLELSNPAQKQQTSYWQSFSNTYSQMPTFNINTGNTTNINASAFSSVDMSRTEVNNVNSNNISVNSNTTSSKTKKEVEEEQKKAQEQADTANRIFWGVTAFVGLLTSVYYAGKSMGELDGVNEDLEDIAVLKEAVKQTRVQLTQNSFQQIQITREMRGKLVAQLNALDDVVTNKVTRHIAQNAKIKLVLRIAAGVSASFVLIGSYFKAKHFTALGGLGSVGTVVVMLFNYARNGSNQRRLKDALDRDINGKIKAILETINMLPKTDMRDTACFANDPQYQYSYYQHSVPVFFTNSPENSNYQSPQSCQNFYYEGSYYQKPPYPTQEMQDNEI